MSDKSSSSKEELKPRGKKRVEFRTKVNLEFERFSGFVSEYSGNISEGGMFVKTDSPQPMGTVFSFEFRLKDDVKLIQGWGEVVWVREAAEGTIERPAGMGVRFIDLDEDSRQLIKKITDHDKNALKGVPEEASQRARQASSLQEIMSDDSLTSPAVNKVAPDPPDSEGVFFDSTVKDADELVPESSEGEEIFLDDDFDDGDGGEPEGGGKKKILLIVLGLWLILGGVAYFFGGTILHQSKEILYTTGLMEPPVAKKPTKKAVVKSKIKKSKSKPQKSSAAKAVDKKKSSEVAVAKVESAKPVQTPVPLEKPQAKVVQEARLPAKEVILPPTKAATTVKNIQFKRAQQGADFTIILDGSIAKEKIKFFPVDSPPPRMVLDIPGIEKVYTSTNLGVSSSVVRQLRFGLHEKPKKLRIVFDMVDGFSGKSDFFIEKNKIVIKVRK